MVAFSALGRTTPASSIFCFSTTDSFLAGGLGASGVAGQAGGGDTSPAPGLFALPQLGQDFDCPHGKPRNRRQPWCRSDLLRAQIVGAITLRITASTAKHLHTTAPPRGRPSFFATVVGDRRLQRFRRPITPRQCIFSGGRPSRKSAMSVETFSASSRVVIIASADDGSNGRTAASLEVRVFDHFAFRVHLEHQAQRFPALDRPHRQCHWRLPAGQRCAVFKSAHQLCRNIPTLWASLGMATAPRIRRAGVSRVLENVACARLRDASRSAWASGSATKNSLTLRTTGRRNTARWHLHDQNGSRAAGRVLHEINVHAVNHRGGDRDRPEWSRRRSNDQSSSAF